MNLNDILQYPDYKLQQNFDSINLIYQDNQKFKNDKIMRRIIVKVTLRIMSFFGYEITDKYNVVLIKPIMRKQNDTVIGLCNPKNISKITLIFEFLKVNNMDMLSALFCLMICKALKESQQFKELVGNSNILSHWLKTQKYLNKDQINQIILLVFGNKVKKEDKKQKEEKEEKEPVKRFLTFDCNICAVEKNVNQKVTCPKCKFECCKSCVKKYILDSSRLNPNCMNCKTDWSLEFIYYNTDESFYNREYREHRAKVLLSMEKSLLPTTQDYANKEAKIRQDKAEEARLKNLFKDSKKKSNFYLRKKVYYTVDDPNPEKQEKYRKKYYDEKSKINRKRQQDYEKRRFEEEKKLNVLTDTQTVDPLVFIRELEERLFGNNANVQEQKVKEQKPKQERPVFIGPCPQKDCKGYLDKNYVCGICKKESCKECRLPKHESKCNPDIVETVKLLEKETKRCPKCNVPIYKTEGCDQMWCPSCHTAFSWNTGEIETGRIHNPHYYQWRRKQGTLPREVGDVRCGGLVDYGQLLILLRRLNLNRYEELIGKLHALVGDIRQDKLPKLAVNDNQDTNRDLRINYLIGEIKEDQWTEQIKRREKLKEKRRSEYLLLEMLAETLEAILDNISRATSQQEVDLQVQQLGELQNYVNKEFDKIEKRFKNKTFHLERWEFNKLRIPKMTK